MAAGSLLTADVQVSTRRYPMPDHVSGPNTSSCAPNLSECLVRRPRRAEVAQLGAAHHPTSEVAVSIQTYYRSWKDRPRSWRLSPLSASVHMLGQRALRRFARLRTGGPEPSRVTSTSGSVPAHTGDPSLLRFEKIIATGRSFQGRCEMYESYSWFCPCLGHRECRSEECARRPIASARSEWRDVATGPDRAASHRNRASGQLIDLDRVSRLSADPVLPEWPDVRILRARGPPRTQRSRMGAAVLRQPVVNDPG